MLAYVFILSAIIAGMAQAPISAIAICAVGLATMAAFERRRAPARGLRLAAIHTAASWALAGLISVGAFWCGLAMAAALQL